MYASTLHTHWKTLEEKWNFEGRFDILVTEICFVKLMSCLLSSNDSMSFQKCQTMCCKDNEDSVYLQYNLNAVQYIQKSVSEKNTKCSSRGIHFF